MMAVFTFHYASTLSHIIAFCETFRKILYIPLCFYFIELTFVFNQITLDFTFHYASTLSRRRNTTTDSIHSLHSIMLLLYRRTVLLLLSVAHLYIPLCFYFISWYCFLCFNFYLLYIPLCFYFIDKTELLFIASVLPLPFHLINNSY